MSRRRFLHLERERADAGKPATNGGDARPPAGVSERFGGQGSTTAESSPSSEAAPRRSLQPERFEPEPDPGLRVQERDPEALPFARCVHCQTDNSRFVETCTRCGNSLRSPEQRAYDAELTERYVAARSEEAAQLKALREERAAASRPSAFEAQSDAANRSWGEALATRERARVESELSAAGEGASLGMRLLRTIPSARARMGVLVGVVALAALPWFVRMESSRGFFFRIVSVGLLLLFAPPRFLSLFLTSRNRWR